MATEGDFAVSLARILSERDARRRIGLGAGKYPFDNITLESNQNSNMLGICRRIGLLFDNDFFNTEKFTL